MVSFSSLRVHAQYVALKSNLLYDALCIPSLGTEVRLDSTHTVSISSTYSLYLMMVTVNGRTGQFSTKPVIGFARSSMVLTSASSAFMEVST